MITWDDSTVEKVIGITTYILMLAAWGLLTFFLLFFCDYKSCY